MSQAHRGCNGGRMWIVPGSPVEEVIDSEYKKCMGRGRGVWT